LLIEIWIQVRFECEYYIVLPWVVRSSEIEPELYIFAWLEIDNCVKLLLLLVVEEFLIVDWEPHEEPGGPENLAVVADSPDLLNYLVRLEGLSRG